MTDFTKFLLKLTDEAERFLTEFRELVETPAPTPAPEPPKRVAVYVDTSGSTNNDQDYKDLVDNVVDALDGIAEPEDFFTWNGSFIPFYNEDSSQVWAQSGTASIAQMADHQRKNRYKHAVVITDGLFA